MTDQQRCSIADSLHSNGSVTTPWWINAVVYQIYPRSFQDSNGDGVGDIAGITSRLDDLQDLGVDVLWLSPVYKSPQIDNGYNIANYEQIDPLFGTLADMDELIHQAHQRGIRIVMDLVVNHTSDENPWFQASRNKDDPHADWYWWRPARPGHSPGEKGAEPNRWGSSFGGSAWTYDPQRKEYYFHTFSRKQPDLNWENPAVRHAVYSMMNWWLDRGIDGFRMDVITLISKVIDRNGRLPGEYGSLIKDNPVGDEGYPSPWPFSMDGPRLDEFLQEMHHEVFDGRHGYMNVGEGQGISPKRNSAITDPQSHELDMLFLFDHMNCDEPGSKWNIQPLELTSLKKALQTDENAVSQRGWMSLYFNNHDQPRSVSRWGDDRSKSAWERSAKALALLMHAHRGTPFIYQGEEIGMTNAHFTELSRYRDVESINAFHQRVEKAHIQSADSMMRALSKVSRDNARTPMQWDNSRYAGFESPSAVSSPWLSVNDNKSFIDVDAEKRDPTSIRSFYKKRIALRHSDPVFSVGDFVLLDPTDQHVYSILRTLDARKLLAVVNVGSSQATIPAETLQLLRADFASSQTLISTDSDQQIRARIECGLLDPWMAFAIER